MAQYNNIYNFNYLPNPPRAWSRVQNSCTYANQNANYSNIFNPITGNISSLEQANYQQLLYYKGNVLQYKNNSANLTKKQKYSQLANGKGPFRTKVFATQTATYTNPNTTGLLLVNYKVFVYPNNIVGAPNNPAGPFASDLISPFDCSNTNVKDGGNLVCGTFANQCNDKIIKQAPITNGNLCFPSYYSNVPGNTILCWNNKLQTYYPKPRYFMNNSGNKFPQGYKGFVSALKPDSPTLSFSQNGSNITLFWTINTSNCIPISGFKIYLNNLFYREIQTNNPNLNNYDYLLVLNSGNYEIYITSISNNIESEKSNIIHILV